MNTRSETTQRVMAPKLIRMAYRITIQLHLVTESCSILAPGGQSGNFWIHPRRDEDNQEKLNTLDVK